MASTGDLKLKDGVFEHGGANVPGWVCNLGISYSAGTFTIVDAQGATLTDANPGFVTVPSTTVGQMVTLKVSSGGTFNDDAHASSDLTGLGWGITESANWANDMPFFLYVVNRANSDINGADGNSAFFISRTPIINKTPASSDDIGDTAGIPVNDNQHVILILDDVTIGNYIDLSAQLIGAFRMQWSSANTDWTVQTLSNTFGDGIGSTNIRKFFSNRWTFPQAQNGASSGTFLLANGGTAPVFSTNNYFYIYHPNGMVTIIVNLSGDGGTDGAGAVTTTVAMPLSNQGVNTTHGLCSMASVVTGAQFAAVQISGNTFTLLEAAATNVQNGDFTNGARDIKSVFSYYGFATSF